MMPNNEFRNLTDKERGILDRLLALPFPGRSEVTAQLADCLVRTIDADGGLAIRTGSGAVAYATMHRIPTEGEAEDADGVTIHFLLHVVDGIATELEIYKEDGSGVKQIPSPDKIQVVAAAP